MTRSIPRGSVFLVLALAACSRSREAAPAEAPEAQAASATAQPGYAEPPPPAAEPAPAPASPMQNEAKTSASGPRDRAAEEGESLQTLEQAEAALNRARAELETAALDVRAERSKAARPSKPASRAADEAEAKGSGLGKAESPCANACRAFASLGRAAGAVCRLAGDPSERCTRARQILVQSEQRVSACKCPANP